MSIIDSFDTDKSAVITPDLVNKKSPYTLSACIINFSYKIMDALIESELVEIIDGESVSTVADRYPIYRFKGTDIGVLKTSIGAPMAAGMIEEVGHIFSCKKFVLFGSGGGLDRSIPPSKLIVPTHAYRDEGMSYHYAPPSDYIEVKKSATVAKILSELGIEFVTGRTWTTDAFYRETKKNMEKRKSEGCIVVEMEVSACQAVCDFRGYEFYPFIYRADNLDSTSWDKSILSLISIDERLKHLFIALEIAKRI